LIMVFRIFEHRLHLRKIAHIFLDGVGDLPYSFKR
jgi:hypothetical protein